MLLLLLLILQMLLLFCYENDGPPYCIYNWGDLSKERNYVLINLRRLSLIKCDKSPPPPPQLFARHERERQAT